MKTFTKQFFIFSLIAIAALGQYGYQGSRSDAEIYDYTSDPSATLNFTQYCNYYNYPVESHKITTADGYILTYFRIQAKYSKIQSGLPVVLLQHGLLDSSDTWIVNTEPIAPGFMLANRGYDVWLGNNRGNKYSLEHVNLSPNDVSFWQFTWQQFAMYDDPAAFTYIVSKTNQKINYIGHSQGTTQMFAALSLKISAVRDNIKSFIALGPVVYVNHQTSELLDVVANSVFPTLLQQFGVQDFLPPNWATSAFGRALCTLFTFVCTDFLGFLADANTDVDNTDRFPIFIGHEPCGTSTLDMLHWRQMVLQSSYIFQLYDYGTNGNTAYYGQPSPPILDIGNIDIPVYLFVGSDDRLADPTDAKELEKNLVNSPHVQYSLYPYGHMTFIWGKEANYMSEVFSILKQYNEYQVYA